MQLQKTCETKYLLRPLLHTDNPLQEKEVRFSCTLKRLRAPTCQVLCLPVLHPDWLKEGCLVRHALFWDISPARRVAPALQHMLKVIMSLHASKLQITTTTQNNKHHHHGERKSHLPCSLTSTESSSARWGPRWQNDQDQVCLLTSQRSLHLSLVW